MLRGKYIDKRTGRVNAALLIQKVIKKSVEKINSITYLEIEYKPIKIGKKIDSIRFFINDKNNFFIKIQKNTYLNKQITIIISKNLKQKNTK